MRPIAPRFPEVPGVREFAVAEDQPEYLTIYAAHVTFEGGEERMFVRWTFTPEERDQIARGEDVYIAFAGRVAPHSVSLRPDWAGR